MTDKETHFSPEDHESSQTIQQLTPESPEAEIRTAFIEWNKEVLMPMIDDIINILETKLELYKTMRITCEAESNAKKYIARAIKVLKTQKAVYCEFVDSLSKATTLSQFLTIMGLLEPGIPGGDWFPVSYGMGDAKISERYHDELLLAVEFRYNEARRFFEQGLDLSYRDALLEQWGIHKRKTAGANLDNLEDKPEENAKILYDYFNNALHPLICKIFAMDKDEEGEWWKVFEEIAPHEETTPKFEILLKGLSNWKTRVERYLASLPEKATQHSDYETTKQDLLEHIDVLTPHLLKLQIAKETEASINNSTP